MLDKKIYILTGCLKKHRKERYDFLTPKLLLKALVLIKTQNSHLFEPSQNLIYEFLSNKTIVCEMRPLTTQPLGKI